METIELDPDGDLILLLAQFDVIDKKTRRIPAKRKRSGLNNIAEVPPNLKIVASSKHMMLASPVFKAMLQGGVIHGNTEDIPETISFKTLVSVCVLCDKYRIKKAGAFFVRLWIKHQEDASPPHFENDNLIEWLAISWVFEIPEIFELVTDQLVLESTGPLDTSVLLEGRKVDLPIPGLVIGIPPTNLIPNNGVNAVLLDTIQNTRTDALSETLAVVTEQITFLQTESLCPSSSNPQKFMCDGMLLGTLIRSAVANGFWPNPPSPPYHGLSYRGTTAQVSHLKVSAACMGAYGSTKDHDLTRWMRERLKVIQDHIDTLGIFSIEHYKPRAVSLGH